MAKKTNKTILVTGATGQQGGAVLRHLRKSGFALRILTRDPEKPAARELVGHGVEVIKGDLEDTGSIGRAVEGVDGIFSVQDLTAGIEGEIRQGKNLADAANREAVSHFVYSSVASADRNTGIPHFDSKFRIEEHIRGLGLPYSIVRPAFFMENWLRMKEQINGGTLTQPLTPEKTLQMVAVDDIGAAVAAFFEHPHRWLGKTVEMAGDEVSMSAVAQAFGTVAGREVKYQELPFDQFEQQAGHEYAVMYRWFQDVGYSVDIDALRQEIPSLTNFERWVNGHWNQGTKQVTA